MDIRIHSRMSEIPAQDWNQLIRDNHPFLRHEFLASLEQHNCVGIQSGWVPRHIGLYDHDQLIGAMPLYEKHNSYGEFVFDHAWANAYQLADIPYYPKLVSATPFTPVFGQRLLAMPERQSEVYPLLMQAVLLIAKQLDASSFHCLFPYSDEQQYLEKLSLITRHDCQFHWHNSGYQNFDDFLARLTARKRKNIRQERRKVSQAGITFRVLNGHTATAEDWQLFTRFYQQTFVEKQGNAAFNQAFFCQIAEQLPDQIVLVMADKRSETVAGALMYHSDTTLYGRHWGCCEQIDSLHFETCYYQGIEYCINNGLHCFEPGAQGEHKIARGFIPTLTRSSHWLADNRYRAAITGHARQEKQWITDYMNRLQSAIPYKQVQTP